MEGEGWRRRVKEGVEGLACADPGTRTPIGVSRIFRRTCQQSHLQTSNPTVEISYPYFWNPRTFEEEEKTVLPVAHSAGGRGGP